MVGCSQDCAHADDARKDLAGEGRQQRITAVRIGRSQNDAHGHIKSFQIAIPALVPTVVQKRQRVGKY